MGFVAMLALAGAVVFLWAAQTGHPPVASIRALLAGKDLPEVAYPIGDERRERSSTENPNTPATPYEGRLLRPVAGPVTSPYGMRWGRLHQGVDIACATGTPVKAAASGRVVQAGWNGGYGNWIKIKHDPSDVETGYAHLSRIGVRTGQAVSQGQVIGHSGSTGDSTGPHLHFEVRINGRAVDPIPYIG